MNNYGTKRNVMPISKHEFEGRIGRLRANMQRQNIDATLLVAGSNMRYFCGLSWGLTERFVGAVITQQDIVFICPKFEESAMRPVLKIDGEFGFWEEHEEPCELVAAILQKRLLHKLAVDPKCPLWLFERLTGHVHSDAMCSAVDLIGELRARKSGAELALIEKAMQLTLKVHKLTFDYLQPGMPASQVIRFIDEAHRQLGADSGSYFCAVQFNEGTSHPHGVPGDPVLEDNSLVLIDTGCQLDGYHSDITRTYAFGELPGRYQEIWEIEKQAQAAAFDAVAPDVPCEVIDQAARDVLLKNGLGPDYKLPGLPHRTGHGIGLEIHEGPYLVKGDSTLLKPGMCFSNEPMIVLPGDFGIRLEDHFFVTETGAQWFTPPQHSFDKPFG